MTQQASSSPPTETKRVRICLSARMRAEWTAVVEVPADASQQELDDLAYDFSRDIDGGEYTDDNDYWETNSPDFEQDVDRQEQTEYRAIRQDGGRLTWRDMDELADETETQPVEPADAADASGKYYRVWVVDDRYVVYVVEADDEDEARRLVEESGGSNTDGQWYVLRVEPARE